MLNIRSPYLAGSVLLVALSALPLPHAVRDAVALLALVLIAVAAWEPQTALVMLVVYLPFRVLVEAMAPTPITFVVDVIVLTMVARVLYRHMDKVAPFDAVEWLGLAFGAWGLVATVHAHASLAGATLEVRDLLEFVLLYAAVRRLRAVGDGLSDDWWTRLVPYALLSIAVVGAQGMVQTFVLNHGFLLPAKLSHQVPVTGVNFGRPYGWLDNPNVFGELGFLALVVAFDYFRRLRFRPTALAALTMAFFATMVVLSFSRSAYLVVLVAAAILFYGTRVRLERLGIAGGVVLMAVAIAIIPGARVRTVGSGRVAPVAVGVARHAGHGKGGGAKTGTHTGKHVSKKAVICPGASNASPLSAAYLCRSSHAGRLHNLVVALHMVRHHPFGTGLGTFGSAGAKAFHYHLYGLPKNFYADNQYAVVLVETGIVGTALFGLFALAALWTALKDRSDSDRRRLAIVLFVSLAILGATSNALEQLVLTVYPWLVLAGVATYTGAVSRRRDEPTDVRKALSRQA